MQIGLCCCLVVLLLKTSLLLGVDTPWERKAPEDIRRSFTNFKASLNSSDWKGATKELSPDTMSFFENCLQIARTPDATNLPSFSQMEVLLGYYAFWQIGSDRLDAMTATDMFAWAASNNLLPLASLVNADLCNLKVSGARASASMQFGNAIMTNSVLAFSRDGSKRWRLDLNDLLIESEPMYEKVRKQQGISKAKMAVMAIEVGTRSPVPALRNILLPANVRKKVAELSGATPAVAYDAVLAELTNGRQRDAEWMLEVLTSIHTNDQRLIFARAVCSRSRFDKSESFSLLKRVIELGHNTTEGKCARFVLDIDARQYPFEVADAFRGLKTLVERNPDNILIPWMMGIACRENYRVTGETSRSLDGVYAYKKVMEMCKVCPVLVYQTYANILDEELGRHEETLELRYKAVAMDPKVWTYQGLANTLARLGRHAEADEAYRQAVTRSPDSVDLWWAWGKSRLAANAYAEAIEKLREAEKLEPGNARILCELGGALGRNKEYAAAKEKFEAAIELGNLYSTFCLGYWYMNPGNPERDYAKALSLLESAVAGGCLEALEYLAYLYYEGKGCPRNEAKALQLYEQSAQRITGTTGETYYRLGLHYASGRILEKHPEKAAGYFQKALQKGEKRAVNDLVWLYAVTERLGSITQEEIAARMKELSQQDWLQMDTLAAAYARNGDFDLAVATQRKAIAMREESGKANPNEITRARSRLALYQTGKPYTENPAPASKAEGDIPAPAGGEH